MIKDCDFLIIGAGLAGLNFALKIADLGHVLVLAKTDISKTNTALAQGGISSVSNSNDSFDDHIQDTLAAGAGLCHEEIVRDFVKAAPDRIAELRDWGVEFNLELTREGGHSHRRVVHVHDHTGSAVHNCLIAKAKQHPNIEILENTFAIDLITNRKIAPFQIDPPECFGAYALDISSGQVVTARARATILATGGAGKAYLYTSNWSGATGDGVAMAHRAGLRVANLEFMQFHPTCLFHPAARNFLITEALRGEGAELVDKSGQAFMKKYHPQGSLAPRDIVARSIDSEMKRTGAECVFLDISHKPADFVRTRFPSIFDKCLSLGIDITKNLLPVVPAAHYLCGGILTDRWGYTEMRRLFAVGETACTGFHGANRLASNSLLECLVVSHNGAEFLRKNPAFFSPVKPTPPDWKYRDKQDQDEMIVIHHMWDEIRQLMWNYVGIVRSNRRLLRAQNRLRNIVEEIKEYYWNFALHRDILELRNIATVADLTVQCAIARKESRGIHFNLDYPFPHTKASPADTVI